MEVRYSKIPCILGNNSSFLSQGLGIVQTTERRAVPVQNIWTSPTFDQGQGHPLWAKHPSHLYRIQGWQSTNPHQHLIWKQQTHFTDATQMPFQWCSGVLTASQGWDEMEFNISTPPADPRNHLPALQHAAMPSLALVQGQIAIMLRK